jgi:hypothetical protein
MSMRIHDRRRHERRAFECPVKVYDPRSRRYRSGVTRNVSATGALIEVHGGFHAGVGDQVSVAIDWSGVTPMISHSDMVPVAVTRLATDADGVQLFGVQFAASSPMPMAA